MKKEKKEDLEFANEKEGGSSNFKEKLQQFVEALSKRLKRDGLRLFFLVLANGLYLYIGGLIFYALEHQPIPEVHPRAQLLTFLDALKNTSIAPMLLSTQHSTRQKVVELTEEDVKSLDAILDQLSTERKNAQALEWNIMNSVFFASTVVTTIGYGNLAPATAKGRAFCVAYAIFGIPMTLILLASIGRILAKYINEMCGIIIQNLRRYFYPDYEYESTGEESDLKAPAWLVFLLLGCFVSLDAVVFMYMENWSFGVSLYFLFITLTTIGFGDIVPHNQAAVWFNVTFLYLGLAAVSITINLFMVNITIQMKRHKGKFKFVNEIERELESDFESETTPLTRGMSTENETMEGEDVR